MRALLSVYDKTGAVELAQGLAGLGWELISSGGTSTALADAGIDHIEVADLTGAPEMLGGRVKTLHPTIHGGILADRARPEHLADLERQGIGLIDLVVCNLYPFASDPSIELIDIGGPTMVRSAAKNHAHVGVVVSPGAYDGVLDELRRSGALSHATRLRLARDAFAHTAAYDESIVDWFDDIGPAGAPDGDASVLPPTIHVTLERAGSLRYGENPPARRPLPDRRATLVVGRRGPARGQGALLPQHLRRRRGLAPGPRGDRARLRRRRRSHHQARQPLRARRPPRPGDSLCTGAGVRSPVGFGGIVAIGGPVTAHLSEAIAAGPQADLIIAPCFDEAALVQLTSKRKATRLLSAPAPEPLGRQFRGLGASMLVQDADRFLVAPPSWEVASKARPTDAQWKDLALAWTVCARTTSNAIAIVTDGQAVGVGAGQQSRVVAAEIAVSKAGARAAGGAAASDAFFPFPDGLLVLAEAGLSAVVQPGGSIRDDEVVAAADEAGIALVMAGGERHFRH